MCLPSGEATICDVVPGERARPQDDHGVRTGQVPDDDVGVLDELIAIGELADACRLPG